MMEGDIKALTEMQSSDTVIELKYVEKAETQFSDQTTDKPMTECVPDATDKKTRPAPLDVLTIQENQQQNMSGLKMPTIAAPTTGYALDRRKIREKKLGHRRVDQEGQITFKKIQTSQIMGSIQLGLGHAIGSLASKPERDLLMLDFTIVETTSFPREGSNITPAHHYSDFKFKSYAPVAFRYFRDLFGIKPDDFLVSLCDLPMIELSNPGASGSIFYLTEDGEFIIKTVQHKEAEFLTKLLPGYYMNLNENPRTLLPKYFGLYNYQCGGKNIRLIVMNNLLPSSIKIHEKYDLKGSTYKRKAGKSERRKESPTFKDLDFIERHSDGILLEPDTYNTLTKIISRDCRVLESFKIMDYSLLVGVHNVDLAKREKRELKKREDEEYGERNNGKISDESSDASPVQKCSTKGLVRSKSMNRSRLAAFSTADSMQAEAFTEEGEDDDIPPDAIPAKNAKGEQLLLFLGIIDILQSFHLKKRIEHTVKSILHDGDTVSVHRPAFYAQRFQNFMSKTVFRKAPALKHSPSKRKPSSGKTRSSFPPATESDASKISSMNAPSVSESVQEKDSSFVDPSYPSNFDVEDSSSVTHDAKSSSSNISLCVQGKSKSSSNTDPPRQISLRSCIVEKTSSVTWERTDVSFTVESTADCVSETSSSSTSGLGSTLHNVTWTPPHSIEGSTPTHTEGTPSFTESSSSGDAACPTTPVKSINKSIDSLPPLGETQIYQGSEVTRL